MNWESAPVSVIIPTYRRQDVLCQTLESVAAQDWPALEIVVVDQTPTLNPSLRDVLQRHAGLIRYHRQERPNLPRARNHGVQLAASDILLFVDDDVLLPANYIRNHVRRLFSTEEIGAVTGPTVAALSDDVNELMPDFRKHFAKDRVAADASGFQSSWLIGCNFSVKRRALRAAGPFDETFTGSAYCEDVDMAVRLWRKGFVLMFDRDAWLVHLALTVGGCETRSSHDVGPRERERLQHLLYCRLKHASFEGPALTFRLLLEAFRGFVLNRNALLRGPSYAVPRLSAACTETWRAYQRVRRTTLSASEQ